ncbi:MAG: hypothetical protein H5T85_04530 [Actinobacteria bacterium]|nr:hypothetical protein [Actinomycetota bacterium]
MPEINKKKILEVSGILSFVPQDFRDIGRAPVGKGEVCLRNEKCMEVSLKDLWKEHLGCFIKLSVELLDHPEGEELDFMDLDMREDFNDIYEWLDKRVVTYREIGLLFLKPKDYGEALFEAIERRRVIGVIGNTGRTISIRKLLEKFLGRRVLLSLKVMH